jgi:hypothetical protein
MRKFLRGFLHRVIEFFRRLIEAFRHVRTGGASTRVAATRRARRAPGRCSTCHQPIQHSQDWRDHLDQQHPEWVERPTDQR